MAVLPADSIEEPVVERAVVRRVHHGGDVVDPVVLHPLVPVLEVAVLSYSRGTPYGRPELYPWLDRLDLQVETLHQVRYLVAAPLQPQCVGIARIPGSPVL